MNFIFKSIGFFWKLLVAATIIGGLVGLVLITIACPVLLPVTLIAAVVLIGMACIRI